ncbi:hypothetical protein R1sor_014075 [Riccia sorocarpa]|uniref:Uncharacterized protein n=1 Tax=Riccia sorocarpa TaxID=122646 RepID=A0ABD3HAA5_9MARC
MALAHSIREGADWNIKKTKNGSVRRRERRGGVSDLSGEEETRTRTVGQISEDSGAVVVLGCYRRNRSCQSGNDFSSSGQQSNSSTNNSFADAALTAPPTRAKRLVSPQGRNKKKTMGWMRKIAGPFRRAWDIVSCRHFHQSRKRARGIGRLYNDVRSCGYEDVQLMWSMLHTHNVERSSKWRCLSRRRSRS